MGKAARIKRRRTKRFYVTPDKDILEKLRELREHVDHLNKQPALTMKNGIYQGADPNAVYTTKSSGFEFGYHLKDLGNVIQRTVYVKCLEARWDEIPDKQRDPIMAAVYLEMLDQGAEIPEIDPIAPDCIRLRQKFATLHLVEKSPGLVNVGRA